MFIVDVYAYRKILIINKKNDHLLFYLFNYFLFIALIDKTFEVELTYNIKNIF